MRSWLSSVLLILRSLCPQVLHHLYLPRCSDHYYSSAAFPSSQWIPSPRGWNEGKASGFHFAPNLSFLHPSLWPAQTMMGLQGSCKAPVPLPWERVFPTCSTTRQWFTGCTVICCLHRVEGQCGKPLLTTETEREELGPWNWHRPLVWYPPFLVALVQNLRSWVSGCWVTWFSILWSWLFPLVVSRESFPSRIVGKGSLSGEAEGDVADESLLLRPHPPASTSVNPFASPLSLSHFCRPHLFWFLPDMGLQFYHVWLVSNPQALAK